MLGVMDFDPSYAEAKFERVQRVLGKAGHPKAIKRLLEIWPDAYVKVMYDPPNWETWFRGGKSGRATMVEIYERPPTVAEELERRSIKGTARCNLSDQFCRESGRRLAFNRALHNLSAIWGSSVDASPR